MSRKRTPTLPTDDLAVHAARELITTFDHIQQKHHPFSVIGTRNAFEFPIALEDDEWEEP